MTSMPPTVSGSGIHHVRCARAFLDVNITSPAPAAANVTWSAGHASGSNAAHAHGAVWSYASVPSADADARHDDGGGGAGGELPQSASKIVNVDPAHLSTFGSFLHSLLIIFSSAKVLK